MAMSRAAAPARWAAVYVAVAAALTLASHLLDARLRTPIGLTRTLYRIDGASRTELSRESTPTIDLSFVDADPRLPRRLFAVRWEGVWNYERSEWVDLYGTGDDLVRVTLDDKVVLERNAPKGTGERRGRFLLEAGRHRLTIEYEQYGGDYLMYVGVAVAGEVPKPLDPQSLFPRRPSLKAIAANRRLLWLARVVWTVWLVPPIGWAFWAALPWFVASGRRLTRRWLERSRANWGCAVSASGSGAHSPPASFARRPVIQAWVAALYIAVVLLFVAAFWGLRDAETGFTRLIQFGEQFQAHALPALRDIPHAIHEQSGYDGQFYAQLALEPLVRNPDLDRAMDSLKFRARRILLPWTAYLLGFGHPPRIIQAYAVQNLLFWLLLGGVLLRWLPPVSLRNWCAWCGCLLGMGPVASVAQALTDLPGVAIVALGFAAAESGWTLLAGGILGVSGLVRETNVLGALGLDLFGVWRGRERARTIAAAVLLAVPLVLWLVYLEVALRASTSPPGDNSLSLPFAGFVNYAWRVIRDVRFDGAGVLPVTNLVGIGTVTLQAAYLCWRADWQRPWWRLGMAYVLLMAVLPAAVLEGNPGAYLRVLLPMSVAFNVLVPGSRWFRFLVIAGNATVMQSIPVLWYH